MHTRPCTARDRSGVIALWETVFPDDPPHNAPAKVFDAKLAMDDGMLFVATDAESVIGTAMAGYDGHRGWLYTVAVSPGHRRRGVGTALVHHAVAALRTTGCIKVNLQIRSTNLAVRGFYESLGFAGRGAPEHGHAHPLRRPSPGCAIGDRLTEKISQNQ